MRYWVRVYRQGKDFSAMVPDLPGCVAAGDSVEEVLELIAEAIAMHVEAMRQASERIPTPTQHLDLELAELEDGEIHTWVEVSQSRGKPRRRQRVGGK
jgi:predicted RNase H-like HicB family nuclease